MVAVGALIVYPKQSETRERRARRSTAAVRADLLVVAARDGPCGVITTETRNADTVLLVIDIVSCRKFRFIRLCLLLICCVESVFPSIVWHPRVLDTVTERYNQWIEC